MQPHWSVVCYCKALQLASRLKRKGGGGEHHTWCFSSSLGACPSPHRYSVRYAVIDLDTPPSWFKRLQAHDHMTADEARKYAGTTGAAEAPTPPSRRAHAGGRACLVAASMRTRPSVGMRLACRAGAAADGPHLRRLPAEPHQRLLLLHHGPQAPALHRRGVWGATWRLSVRLAAL